MAMNIISKEKKEIRWIGLPTSSVQECKKLEEEKIRRMERIYQKTENLKDMIIQVNRQCRFLAFHMNFGEMKIFYFYDEILRNFPFLVSGIQKFGRKK